MAYTDSIDKIVSTYIAKVATQPFTYKKKTYTPKPLMISPLIFRDFICKPGCGGCCPRFSLDYLPFELRPEYIETPRKVVFNGEEFDVYSDLQDEHTNPKCKHLVFETGLCGIHKKPANPFSCDFEIIRFLEFKAEDVPNRMMVKNFGRGWQMMRVDGQRGALCEILPVSENGRQESIRKIKRLKEWCNYFKVENRCDTILEYLETGLHKEQIIIQ